MKCLLFSGIAALTFACSPKHQNQEEYPEFPTQSTVIAVTTDPTKGIGAVKTVTLKTPLEKERVGRGLAIFNMKCSACHKLTSEKLVGPGWKDLTKQRQPEWIMNMTINVDVMLDKDPEAHKLLQLWLVRMPNQNISIDEARDILEYMRMNDGQK